MTLRLREILNMKEMQEAKILAGANGLDRIVKSTTVIDAPDGIKWLKGTELVFTTTYPLLDSQGRLDMIVQELAIRNVSGLALKLSRYMRSIPQDVIDCANEFEFPIISIPNEKAWADLINPIMSEILNLRTRRLIRSEEINRNFTKVLLADSSLEEIAELLNYYIDNPVFIINVRGNNVVSFPADSSIEVNEFLHSYHYSTSTFKETIDREHNITRLWFNQVAHVVLSFQDDVDQEVYMIIKEMNRTVSIKDDLDCLLHAINAVSLKILHLKAQQEFKRRNRNDFALRLLQHKYDESDLSELHRKAWNLGLELKNEYILTAITVTDKEPEFSYKMMDEINYYNELRDNSIICLDKENQLIIMSPVDDGYTNDMLISYVQQIMSYVILKQGDFEWAAGISQTHNVLSLPAAYHQSIKALYHGIEMAGYNHIQHYDDLGIYRLFSHPALQEEITYYVKELLSPLMRYDEVQQSNLVETLRVFLDNKGNYRQTAEVMYLHHNTVRYRIETIRKISGLDVRQSHIQLQCQIAFILLPLIRTDILDSFKEADQSES